MYIHEAIQVASQLGLFISRTSWVGSKDRNGKISAETVVLPTNTPDGCIVLSPYAKNQTQWTPSKDDLLADDWEPACLIIR